MVTIFTPGGKRLLDLGQTAFTRLITSSAFSRWRMITMPAAVSPSPSSSATPRRISGPSWMLATSRSSTGVPRSSLLTTICSRSADVLDVAASRTMYSAPLHSTSRAPTSLFDERTASITSISGTPVSGELVRIDGDLVLPHEPAERRHLGDAGHGLQLISDRPVLQRAQIRRASACRSYRPARTGRPTRRRWRPGRAPSSPLAAARDWTFERYSSTRLRAQ